VIVLLDLTLSMRASRDGAPAPAKVARRAASDFVRAIPADQKVEISALGIRPEYVGCTAPLPLTGGDGESDPRAALIGRIESSGEGGTVSESSLALAVDGARRKLEARRVGSQPVQIVVFSDLADDCGGNWCDAVARAAGAGVNVDVVAMGDRDPSPCLEGIDVPAQRRARLSEGGTPVPPVFRVRGGTDGSGEVLANGRAGSGPIEVPAGSVTVAIELEPEESVGPIRLQPGSHTRIRVVDFFQSKPPWREVFVQPMETAVMQPSARVEP